MTGEHRDSRARSRRAWPGRASRRRGRFRRAGATRRHAWSEKHSDEGASTAAARAPESGGSASAFRCRGRRPPGCLARRSPAPQVRARAACPGLGRPSEASSLRPRRFDIAFGYVKRPARSAAQSGAEGVAVRVAQGAGVPPRNEVERDITAPGPIGAPIGQRPCRSAADGAPRGAEEGTRRRPFAAVTRRGRAARRVTGWGNWGHARHAPRGAPGSSTPAPGAGAGASPELLT